MGGGSLASRSAVLAFEHYSLPHRGEISCRRSSIARTERLPPAVPAEEPQRLPLPQRHRRPLPTGLPVSAAEGRMSTGGGGQRRRNGRTSATLPHAAGGFPAIKANFRTRPPHSQ